VSRRDVEQRRPGSGDRAASARAVGHADTSHYVTVANREDLSAPGRARETDRGDAVALADIARTGFDQTRCASRCRGVRVVSARESGSTGRGGLGGGPRPVSTLGRSRPRLCAGLGEAGTLLSAPPAAFRAPA